MAIGSIEGSGAVFLGANNLSVGSNNLSTILSGKIQDGGLSGGQLITRRTGFLFSQKTVFQACAGSGSGYNSGVIPVIRTLPEARVELKKLAAQADMVIESAKSIQAFFDRFEGALSVFQGEIADSEISKTTPTGMPPSGPSTISERIVLILKESKKPLMPKDIVQDFATRGWLTPNKGTVYGLIGYLGRKKHLVSRTAGGYVYQPNGQISENETILSSEESG